MDMRGYQRYREDSLSTMTQGELLLLLFDELVKRLTQAELELEREHYPAFEAAVDRSVKIIRYLDDTLDRQYPISQNLDRLYEYFCYELQPGQKWKEPEGAFPGQRNGGGAEGQLPTGG